jgi:3-oxoacyl-[acyl-carrier-protein] synthase II
MKLYIHGSGCISPQQSWGEARFLSTPISFNSNRLTCVEPDYSEFVDVKAIRRMSRIIKMGIASSTMALTQAKIKTPDAIITGTGYGCLDDTGTFLSKMIENKEQALNPTPFIQSTHNTIGSQIALLLQCQGYNQTYTQGSFSFENALLDAFIQVSESPDKKILVGAIDEITSTSHAIQERFGIFRDRVESSLDLLKTSQKGTVNGEGSSFFVVSGSAIKGGVCVEGVSTLYKPSTKDIISKTSELLRNAGLGFSDIDLLLIGQSGDAEHDQSLDEVCKLFTTSSIGVFKHLCGEFPVASSFAVWLASEIIRHQVLPKVIIESDKGRSLNRILIYNQYFGSHHSMILLSKC